LINRVNQSRVEAAQLSTLKLAIKKLSGVGGSRSDERNGQSRISVVSGDWNMSQLERQDAGCCGQDTATFSHSSLCAGDLATVNHQWAPPNTPVIKNIWIDSRDRHGLGKVDVEDLANAIDRISRISNNSRNGMLQDSVGISTGRCTADRPIHLKRIWRDNLHLICIVMLPGR
jgi:hypothetical protein